MKTQRVVSSVGRSVVNKSPPACVCVCVCEICATKDGSVRNITVQCEESCKVIYCWVFCIWCNNVTWAQKYGTYVLSALQCITCVHWRSVYCLSGSPSICEASIVSYVSYRHRSATVSPSRRDRIASIVLCETCLSWNAQHQNSLKKAFVLILDRTSNTL